MKNKLLLVTLILLSAVGKNAYSQNQKIIDSLLVQLDLELTDYDRVDTYVRVADEYDNVDSTQTAYFANLAISIAEKIGYNKGISDAYYELGWTTMQRGYLEESLQLYKSVLLYAEKDNYDKGKSNAFNGMAFIFRWRGEYDRAREYYHKSLQLRESLNDKKGASSTLRNIGATFMDQGNYSEALQSHIQSMKIAESILDKTSISSAHHSIGLIYDHQQKYDQAMAHYHEALHIYTELGNSRGVALLYNNLAIIAKEKGMDSLALAHHSKALDINTKLNDKNAMSANYANIGSLLVEQKEYKKGLEYASNAYRIGKQFGRYNVVCSALISRSIIYRESKKYTESRNALLEGLEVARAYDFPDFIRDMSYNLAILEKSQGRFKDAYKAYERYHQYYDSLLGEQKTDQLSALEVAYETEKKEQEIENLNQLATIQSLELRQSNLNLIILGIAMLVLLMFGAIVYLMNRQKRLALNQKNQDMEQKLLRVQMNPHFIFNAMSSIQDYMVQGDAVQASNFLTKFSQLIRQVLDNSRSEYISLAQEVNMLENYISLQNLKRNVPLQYKIEFEDSLDTEEIAIPPMFAQPFVENVFEHALAKNESAKLSIRFSLHSEYLNLNIIDNGIGIQEEPEKAFDHVSHATQITKERIELFKQKTKRNISFEIKSPAKGTEVNFNLPFEYI